MVKIDLITGFLGSGKTTFLKKYAKRLMEQGQNIGILENDFGAVNVDMMLLQELEGEQCELEMISGGCDPTDEDSGPSLFQWECVGMTACSWSRRESTTWTSSLTCCTRSRWISGMRLAM